LLKFILIRNPKCAARAALFRKTLNNKASAVIVLLRLSFNWRNRIGAFPHPQIFTSGEVVA
jgi:hypothetical protein